MRAQIGELPRQTTCVLIDRAIARQDSQTLARYARFIGPIAERLGVSAGASERKAIKAATNDAFTRYESATRRCR